MPCLCIFLILFAGLAIAQTPPSKPASLPSASPAAKQAVVKPDDKMPAKPPEKPVSDSATKPADSPFDIGLAKRPEARPWVQRVFDVKYADVDSLTRMLKGTSPSTSQDHIEGLPALHAIAVGAYNPATLTRAEELITRFDVPQMSVAQNHDFEIVAYFLLAGQGPGDPIPKDLEAVAKQLSTAYGYQDLKLLDSSLVRSREGREAAAKGALAALGAGASPVGSASAAAKYEWSVKMTRLEPGAKRSAVVLYGFHFVLKAPVQTAGQTDWQEFSSDSDLSIVDGEKTVALKSRIGSEDKTVIVVMTARVLE